MRCISRSAITLTDPDHISYAVTVDDPKVFTRPWNMNMILYRRKEPNVQLLDYECYGFDFEKLYPYPETRSSQMRTERLIVSFAIGAALLSAPAPVVGQGREGAAKPAAASRPWPPERLADGQPDVQGIWACRQRRVHVADQSDER